jgi:hypothetical protein
MEQDAKRSLGQSDVPLRLSKSTVSTSSFFRPVHGVTRLFESFRGSASQEGPAFAMADQESVQRICIFCGSDNLTREHVYPQWLSRWVPKDSVPHERFGTHDRPVSRLRPKANGYSITYTEDDEEKGRSPVMADSVLRCVCKQCNNGWMAALEEEPKPILIRQMTDPDDRLTRVERHVLLRWLAKTTAVYEMDDPVSVVLTQDVRAEIAQEDWKPKGLWEFDSMWVPNSDLYCLAHGRARLQKETVYLDQSMMQAIALGRAGYLVQYRTGIGITQRCTPIRRMPLWPRFSEEGIRPSASLMSWGDVLCGDYNTAVEPTIGGNFIAP